MTNEGREGEWQPLAGEPETGGEVLTPAREEPAVLPPKAERSVRTLPELEQQLAPASGARHMLDVKKFEVEKALAAQKEKERKMKEVLEQLQKRAKLIDQAYMGLGKVFRGKASRDAHAAVVAVEAALQDEEILRSSLENEYAEISRQESKLLSAMQPDARKVIELRKEKGFEDALRDIVGHLRGLKKRNAPSYEKECTDYFGNLLRSRPDKEEQIRAAEEALNNE